MVRQPASPMVGGLAIRTFDLEPNRRAWGLLANGLVECCRAGSHMRDVANVYMGLTGFGTSPARRLSNSYTGNGHF